MRIEQTAGQSPQTRPEAKAPTRPAWWTWVRLSDKTYRQLAGLLGVSHTHLWQLGLPLNDNRRVVPDGALAAKIAVLTEDEVPADSWPALEGADQ